MHGCDGKSHSLGRPAPSAGTGSGGESGAEQEPGGESGAGGSAGISGAAGDESGGTSGSAGRGGGSGGTAGALDGEAGEPATSGRGGFSGAASGQGGSSGAAAGGLGGAGAGGAETWTVRKFVDAKWAAFCHTAFHCTVVESDNLYFARSLYGTEARCLELVTRSPNGYEGVADLIETVDEGRAILMPEHVPACLEALARCDYYVNSHPADAACRRVFEGTTQTGEACNRHEECAVGGQCHVIDACPGTCEPRPTIGEECGLRVGNCDDSDGLVSCFNSDDFISPMTCDAVTILPPAGEGEPCMVGIREDRTFQSCAEGLWCQGDGYYEGLDPRIGICRGSPIPGGDPCDNDEDVCEEGYGCDTEVCRPFVIVGDGAPCGEIGFCDFLERLECVAGYCQKVGDGTEGSRCLPWENVGYLPCNQGLVCVTSFDPVTSQESSTCLPPLAAGEGCLSDGECASEACNDDFVCEQRFCEKSYFL